MSPFIWLGAILVFVVIEIITLGLTTIWFAGGALVAFLLNLAGFSVMWQIIVFLLVSFLLLLAVRPLADSKLNQHTEKTNIDDLIGREVKVTERISNIEAKGKAVLRGMEWTARSEDDKRIIEEGSIVTVVRVEGVKLIVK